MTIDGVLETCLYAADLTAAERFYAGLLGLEVHSRGGGRHVFFRCGPAMLLVFDPDRTSSIPMRVGESPVPAHGARGPGHVALAVREADLERWKRRLSEAGVAVESEVAWPGGGRSIYVRDPAGNSVELATRRIWGLAE